MVPEDNSTQESTTSSNGRELSVLPTILDALSGLDQEARARILRTVATFFGLSFGAVPSEFPNVSERHQAQADLFSHDRSMTPKQFLSEKRPLTDIERIACLSYYLTHYRNTQHFKTLDLSKLNTEAAQIKLSNAAQAVDNATKAGFLAAATKGNKQIAATGEQFVQALPDRQAAKDAVAALRPRRRLRRGKKPGQV